MPLPVTREWWRKIDYICHGWQPQSPEQHLPGCITAEEAIYQSTQWLIEHLYVPNERLGAVFSEKSLGRLGMSDTKGLDEEPINWGDLKGIDVERKGDGWIVTLEEAEEGKCPILCSYIEYWLGQWGWRPVEVRTVW